MLTEDLLPRSKAMPRATFSMSPKLSGVLKDLADRRSLTASDILRRAFTLYEYVDGQKDEGLRLVLFRDDRGEVEIVKEIVLN